MGIIGEMPAKLSKTLDTLCFMSQITTSLQKGSGRWFSCQAVGRATLYNKSVMGGRACLAPALGPLDSCGQGVPKGTQTFLGWDLFTLSTLGFPVSKKMGLDAQLHEPNMLMEMNLKLTGSWLSGSLCLGRRVTG